MANKNKEEYIAVPLGNAVKFALAKRAAKNSRSLGREAAVILTKALMNSRRRKENSK